MVREVYLRAAKTRNRIEVVEYTFPDGTLPGEELFRTLLGDEPVDAVKAVTELLSEGIVEQWDGPSQKAEVLSARGKLPEVSGAIDISSRSLFSSKGKLNGSTSASTVATEGGRGNSE